jgi:DeoD family purine-nucleoside phosphorylase
VRDLVHIHQTAELAERVLLPGDPGRALRLAQALLDSPLMLNHNRGLWGYTGLAADGLALSIQSTGMGGPSAAIVATELIELGARQLVRLGTCGGLSGALELGQLIVVTEALADDGTSTALGGHDRLARVSAAGPGLPAALLAAGQAATPPAIAAATVSSDLFYGAEPRVERWRAAGALAVEMEAAAVFTVAAQAGAQAGCLLVVSNIVGGDGYIDAQALHAAELRLGELALAALGPQ